MTPKKELKLIRAMLSKALDDLDSTDEVKFLAARLTISCCANEQYVPVSATRFTLRALVRNEFPTEAK